MKQLCIFALLVFAGYAELFAQVDRDFFDSSEGYLGQAKPGDTPVVFAPSLVSTPERYAATIAFSPDGRKRIVYINSWPNSCAFYTEYKDKAWSEPVKARFSEKYPADEPVISLDGKRIYHITRKESMDHWADAYVAPDESLIIFNATWPDGPGKAAVGGRL